MTTTEVQKIREKALRYLARRDYSCRELTSKLNQFDEALVQEVIAKLTDSGLQSDSRFAGVLVRSRVSQGHGPTRIKAELKQKGVNPEIIEEILDEHDIDWFQLALDTHNRRFGETQPDTYQEKAKRMRFLQYRGFTFDQIQYATQA